MNFLLHQIAFRRQLAFCYIRDICDYIIFKSTSRELLGKLQSNFNTMAFITHLSRLKLTHFSLTRIPYLQRIPETVNDPDYEHCLRMITTEVESKSDSEQELHS